MHMRRTADRLFGADYRWSVLGAGRMQMPIAAMAAAMGAHVRVGLEDSLWIGKGNLPAATPSRFAVCAASSRDLGSRRPRRTRRATSCISKGPTRSRSDVQFSALPTRKRAG